MECGDTGVLQQRQLATALADEVLDQLVVLGADATVAVVQWAGAGIRGLHPYKVTHCPDSSDRSNDTANSLGQVVSITSETRVLRANPPAPPDSENIHPVPSNHHAPLDGCPGMGRQVIPLPRRFLCGDTKSGTIQTQHLLLYRGGGGG